MVPPLDLTILHPSTQNGTIYLQPNNTRLLLRVQSRYETKVSWRGSNSSVLFQFDCPREFPSCLGLCQPGPNQGSTVDLAEPSLYAVLDLNLRMKDQTGAVQVELEAHNNVTEASLIVFAQLEEPLRVLVVQPHPAQRVLMESVVVRLFVFNFFVFISLYYLPWCVFVFQSYTASVQEGSNPTFRWTVDDKPFFTYYNTVLNVIYQHAAVYKLTVR